VIRCMAKKKTTAPLEVKCEACNGTGFPLVIQPARSGRKIYPPPCAICGGKGRITSPVTKRKKEI
jgi:DnaJ-class molecular chaperone